MNLVINMLSEIVNMSEKMLNGAMIKNVHNENCPDIHSEHCSM